jgi:hypothetical protein
MSPKKLIERFYNEVWNRADEVVAREILHPEFCFRGSLGEEKRSCPRAWCRSGVVRTLRRFGRCRQAATAGSLKIGSSLNGAIVSRVI